MKKYNCINLTTKEKTLCEKVEIDGFEYYIDRSRFISKNTIMYNSLFNCIVEAGNDTLVNYDSVDGNYCALVICTTNQNIDLPKVVDMVEELAEKRYTQITPSQRTAYKLGYNQSQSTHPFSEEDMVEFAEWLLKLYITSRGEGNYVDDKGIIVRINDLFKRFKDQQIKTVYYK